MSIKFATRDSDEQPQECPLCMEILEADDIHFYPCLCGYQICLFCWHRIKTDENGLCPACRSPYSENPVGFKTLSSEEIQQLKSEKKQKEIQKKQKLSENRKHLQSLRVVQKNLVFVVGLPIRLADAESLKKTEYFGKYGKIHKLVVNTTTSYAGVQGPSCSAYITYIKPEDALKAIQSLNAYQIEGRPVKASLGTTKYCSFYLKHHQCLKTGKWSTLPDSGWEFHGHKSLEELKDCMYLHEIGDETASFTKEEMQLGKHLEYEKKLHEQMLANEKAEKNQKTEIINNSLHSDEFPAINSLLQPSSSNQNIKPKQKKEELAFCDEKTDNLPGNSEQIDENAFNSTQIEKKSSSEPIDTINSSKNESPLSSPSNSPFMTPIGSLTEGTSSTPPAMFSNSSCVSPDCSNVIPNESDWQHKDSQNLGSADELDFDPCDESTKALAEIMKVEEEEKRHQSSITSQHLLNGLSQPQANRTVIYSHDHILPQRTIPNPPPGFLSPASPGTSMRPHLMYKENGYQEILLQRPNSYLMARQINNNDIYNPTNSPQQLSHMNSQVHSVNLMAHNSSQMSPTSQFSPIPNRQQEEFRKMLPNVKISFGPQNNQEESPVLIPRNLEMEWPHQDFINQIQSRENLSFKFQQMNIEDRVVQASTLLNQKVPEKSWSYQQQMPPPGFASFNKHSDNRKGVQNFYNGQQPTQSPAASNFSLNYPYLNPL